MPCECASLALKLSNSMAKQINALMLDVRLLRAQNAELHGEIRDLRECGNWIFCSLRPPLWELRWCRCYSGQLQWLQGRQTNQTSCFIFSCAITPDGNEMVSQPQRMPAAFSSGKHRKQLRKHRRPQASLTLSRLLRRRASREFWPD